MRKRRHGFLLGLAVAVITFGGLWFGLGSDQFNRGHKVCEREYGCMMAHHQNHCGDAGKTVQANVENDSIAK